ncbi:unnamed protein product [Fusarium graminearum]|uniref:Uncharacterized protein n=1 Tax=Gibberella zeae TaxID=5518 RepID=A0A4U9F2A2_GIBZA|nr:hypothetical protein HG531_004642 [Fusarium graminearum]CAG1984091.1 unnamed protein product [Fusarium graminearum]CAG1991325.1 unnamed protein product [Fusarium graminearum]CAG2009007.1 unnamed protein product [Fusarium graminearum]VTO88835.1 unnamed protein product [Fusarium graminearum]
MSQTELHNPPPTTDFLFVNIARPQDIKNRRTQKKINSHVMKPIGLTRRRHRPNKAIPITLPSPAHSDSNGSEKLPVPTVVSTADSLPRDENPRDRDESDHNASAQDTPSSAPIPRHCLRLIPSPVPEQKKFRSLPMSARTRKMIHFLAIAQEAPVCQLMRELCFSLSFVDESAFHLALARLEVDPERTGGQEPHETASSLLHYDASVENLRQRFDGPVVKAHEAIIGVVVNLACYDLFTNNIKRGGINTLTSRYIRVTAIWVDLIGSMALDQVPYLAFQKGHTDRSQRTYEVVGSSLDVEKRCHANINEILQMLSRLSSLARGKSEFEQSQDDDLLEALQTTIHAVLTLPRYGNFESDEASRELCLRTYEIVRLAALLYLSGPTTFLAGNRRFNLVTPQFRGRLSRLYGEQGLPSSVSEPLKLFVLVAGAIVEVDNDRQFFVNHLSHVVSLRKLSWEDVMSELRSMAWFDVVWSMDLDRLRGDLAVKMTDP